MIGAGWVHDDGGGQLCFGFGGSARLWRDAAQGWRMGCAVTTSKPTVLHRDTQGCLGHERGEGGRRRAVAMGPHSSRGKIVFSHGI